MKEWLAPVQDGIKADCFMEHGVTGHKGEEPGVRLEVVADAVGQNFACTCE